jgi:hypothetical protein
LKKAFFTENDKLDNLNFALLLSFFIFFNFATLRAKEHHIAVIVRSGWSGEVEFACRIQKAALNLNWQADIVDYKDKTIDSINYDFVLCLVPEAPKLKHYTYLTLFDPKNHFFNEDGALKEEYSNFYGYLLTYKLKSENKAFNTITSHPWMEWYPSTQFIEYEEPKFSGLFYVCSNWSQRSSDPRYKIFLNLLDRQPYTRLYGLGHFKKLYPNSYVSYIPVDGTSILKEIHKAGVSLVLHSSDHLNSEIPSGRIFEATGSSSLVICDKNPFVIEHFGDSVLYIEQDKDGFSMFKQVENHINWIATHKEDAIIMAKKAHNICHTKFSLEMQLLKLGELHKISLNSKD